jgi:hypothetical protein
MAGSGSCSTRATAHLGGCGWRPTTRITADRMSAANAVRSAAAVESSASAAAGTTSTAAGVGTSTAVSTAAVGTAVKTAAVGAPVRTATTVEFTAAGVAMAATMRTTAVGPAMGTAAVRTFSAMLRERGVRGANEGERSNRCKQDAYG